MCESAIEWCISRAPDSHRNDPGFGPWGDKTLSTFLVCEAAVLVKESFGGGPLAEGLSSWPKLLGMRFVPIKF